MTVLETNIDDLNPQVFSYVIERIMKSGAQDAFFRPVLMKKGRFGFLLTIVCRDALKEKMLEIIFSETTSFGVKINSKEHVGLGREVKRVKTKYGFVRLNIGRFKNKIKAVSPEYDDCAALARRKKVPLKAVLDEAKRKLKN